MLVNIEQLSVAHVEQPSTTISQMVLFLWIGGFCPFARPVEDLLDASCVREPFGVARWAKRSRSKSAGCLSESSLADFLLDEVGAKRGMSGDSFLTAFRNFRQEKYIEQTEQTRSCSRVL